MRKFTLNDKVWMCSDTHFGHKNILVYCDRPWDDVVCMNKGLIERWNDTVPPDGLVIHLGDVAMGGLDTHLPLISQLNGTKILICGNHDQPWKKPQKAQRYLDAGFSEVLMDLDIQIDDLVLKLAHVPYPYHGPNHDGNRTERVKPTEDNGVPLICGHVHDDFTQMWSAKGTPMLNVGMDVWDYRPVSIKTVYNTMRPMV